MRWQLLRSITELEPARSIAGQAHTSFPEELFADHFPSFAVTPGVLLVEMTAQLAGLLVQATQLDRDKNWIFPVLTIIRETKFRRFVPPNSQVQIEARLESIHWDSASCRCRLSTHEGRCLSSRLVFSFDPTGELAMGDAEQLQAYARSEYQRLGSPWQPEDDEA